MFVQANFLECMTDFYNKSLDGLKTEIAGRSNLRFTLHKLNIFRIKQRP